MAKSIANKNKFFTREEFSDEFIYNLIEQCCKIDPNERISAENIKKLLYRKINFFENNYQVKVKTNNKFDLDLKLMLSEFTNCDKTSFNSIDLAFSIGEEYLNRSEYKEALKYHRLSLKYKIKLKVNPESQAESYMKIAFLYSIEKIINIDESKRNYIKAINILEMLKNDKSLCICYYEFAYLLHKAEEIERSIHYHKKAYEISKIIQGSEQIKVGANAYRIGYLSRLIDNYDQSLEYLQIAKQVYYTINRTHIMITEICYEIGLTLFYLSRYNEAVDYLEKLETYLINKNMKKHSLLLNVFIVTGSALCKLYEFEKAEEYFSKALKLVNNSENSVQYAICQNNLAIIYKNTSRPQKALEYLHNALKIFTKNLPHNDVLIQLTSNNIGLTNFSLGEINEAINKITNSLQVCLQTKGDKSIYTSDFHYNLGCLLLVNNCTLQEASNQFELAFSKRIKNLKENHLDIAIIYYKKTLLSIFGKDLLSCKSNLEKSIEILNYVYSEPNIYSIIFYRNVGNLLITLDEIDDGIYCLERELRLRILYKDKNNIACCYKSIGEAYLKKKEFHKALSYMEIGRSLLYELYGKDDSRTKMFFQTIGEIYKELGNVERAEENFSKAF